MKTALWLAPALVGATGCTRGNSNYDVQVDAGRPHDGPVRADTVPADTALPVDATAAPDDASDVASMVNGLRGIYYAGPDHDMPLVERTDPTINFSWVHASPDPLLPVDDFSVRWFARIQPRYSERYTLSIVSDDGARLMINGQYLFDRWVTQSSVENSGQIDLVAGQLYDIQIDYFDRQLTALVRFYWSSLSQAKEIVPQSRLFTR
jgi:hypothetical protein